MNQRETFARDEDIVQAEPFFPVAYGIPEEIEVLRHQGDQLEPVYKVKPLNQQIIVGDWIVRNETGAIVRVVGPEEFAKTYRRIKT